MAIRFRCYRCNARIKAPNRAAGERHACPRCRRRIAVPAVTREERADASAPRSSATDPMRQPSPVVGLRGRSKPPFRFREGVQAAFAAAAKLVRTPEAEGMTPSVRSPLIGAAACIALLAVWVVVNASPQTEQAETVEGEAPVSLPAPAPTSDRPSPPIETAPPERVERSPGPAARREGLTTSQRRAFFADYMAAEQQARRQAREEFPADEGVVRDGETIVLTRQLVLLSHTDIDAWLEAGTSTIPLLPGMHVHIERTIEKDGRRWTQVVAETPGSATTYKGWLSTRLLARQHPILTDEQKLRERTRLQERRARQLSDTLTAEVLQRYSLTRDEGRRIEFKGVRSDWPIQ